MQENIKSHGSEDCVQAARKAYERAEYEQAEEMLLDELNAGLESGVLRSSIRESLYGLAATYCMLRRYEDAIRVYKKVLAAKEASFGASHPRLRGTLERMAVVLKESGRDDEARNISARAFCLGNMPAA